MMNLFASLTFGCLFFMNGSAIAQTFNILDYGAVGDGKTLNTHTIQKTIDACFQSGGGTVLIPGGIFLTGTLHLKSNITLHLEPSAVIRGSKNLTDYEPFNQVHYGMFYTENSENIAITGTGTIDGNGDHFFYLDSAKVIGSSIKQFTRQKDNYRKVAGEGLGDGPVVPKDRPYQMLIFSNCKRITIRDIFISQAPMWTILFADCDGVLVDGIRLWTNMLAPNADGIDVSSCTNVIISNCDIRSGDDAIAIVGYDHHFELPGFKNLRHPSENILVTGCNLQSYSSAIRIGSLDQNSVKNIIVTGCNIYNSTRGIGIFCRDEGSLENINISNTLIESCLRTGDWWGNGEPIHISAIRGKENVQMGRIRNVKFDQIICRGENGILLYGTEESILENISFNNVTLEIRDSPLNEVAGGNIDLRNTLVTGKEIFEREIPGLLAENVSGLIIQNFSLDWTNTRHTFFTHGIEVSDFSNLVIRDFIGSASPSCPDGYPVYLHNGKNAEWDKTLKVLVKDIYETPK